MIKLFFIIHGSEVAWFRAEATTALGAMLAQ